MRIRCVTGHSQANNIPPTVSAMLVITVLRYLHTCYQAATSLTPLSLPEHHFPDPASEIPAHRELLVRIFEFVKYFYNHPRIRADGVSYSS